MTTTMKPYTLAAVGLAATMLACGNDALPPEQVDRPATPVRTVVASISHRSENIRGSGIVSSRAELDLAFKLPGYVQEILVEEGDRVRAGQPLARLEMTEADAQLRAAQAQADLAAKNLSRMERLYADSVVTQARLDEARDAHEQAEAGLERAGYNRDHATILAPADGRILRRMIEVSQFTSAGVPAFRFGVVTSGWVLRIGVADRQVVRVALGDSAQVTVSALEGRVITGRVTEISAAADPRSGSSSPHS